MSRFVFLVVSIGLFGSTAAIADNFHVTDAEKAACTSDAVRFCYGTYPDESRLLTCMKENRAALSSVCRVAFDAGVRRRHL